MMTPISFFVEGIAKPAGSKRGFYAKKIKRVIITDDCAKSKDWKIDVKAAAALAYTGPLIDLPLAVKFTFLIRRPKCHYRTGKNAHLLRDSAPKFPTTKPDVLKLARGVEDAMTGIIYTDDSLIVSERLFKRYADRPGVMIEISEEVE